MAKTHGMSKTRLYHIWASMMRRCKNLNDEHYGMLGIGVCDEWLKFEPFMEWALSHGYDETLSIDRIDGKKGYAPSNCRWATPKEQANNTDRNVVIEMNGESHTLAEWCERTNIVSRDTVYKRVRKHGWSIEDALFTPPLKPGQRISHGK